MNLRASICAFLLLLVGCGLKLASPDGRIASGRDSSLDQSSSLARVGGVAAGGDHSRASGLASDSISGANVVNFVVQSVERAPGTFLRAFVITLVVALLLMILVAVLWLRLRRALSDLAVVIRGVELSGGDVKRVVADLDVRRSSLHHRVQRIVAPVRASSLGGFFPSSDGLDDHSPEK